MKFCYQLYVKNLHLFHICLFTERYLTRKLYYCKDDRAMRAI